MPLCINIYCVCKKPSMFRGVYLLVVLVVITALKELALDVFPQLALVVVLVPLGDAHVKKALEGKGTGEDGGDVNGVSLEQRGENLLLVVFRGMVGQRREERFLRNAMRDVCDLEMTSSVTSS